MANRWGKCDFSQFKNMQKKMQKFSDSELDKFCVECSKELAARLLALVIPVTPVGEYPKRTGKKGGTLRHGWVAKSQRRAELVADFDGKNGVKRYVRDLPVNKVGNNYTIEIVNPVEYASYVEFGHRTRSGKGWVEGRYMLTISEEKLKKIAPKRLEKMLLGKLKEICDGKN